MRDVEEVMVGFESTVESCQECVTLALRAGAVPIQCHLCEISADFFGEKSCLTLDYFGSVTSKVRNVSVDLAITCMLSPKLWPYKRTERVLLILEPNDLTENLPGHVVPTNGSLLRQVCSSKTEGRTWLDTC